LTHNPILHNNGRGSFWPTSTPAAHQALAGPLAEARKALLDQLTPIREALDVAAKTGSDARNPIAAFERNRDALAVLGARVFATHVYLTGDDQHPDALSGGDLCAVMDEQPCHPDVREYAEYVDEVLTALKNMKTAA
jgi:hypothetical protein